MIRFRAMSDEHRSRASLPVGKLPVEQLRPMLARVASRDDVVVGPGVGRDVAVVDPDPAGDRYWLLTADPITFATDEIGRYAVTVNANDIATAGGVPRWLLATWLLPEAGCSPADVERWSEQLRTRCEELGVALVGGHTEITAGLDRPIVSCAMVGDVHKDRLVRWDGMGVGDVVLCTKGVPLEGASILAREKRATLLEAGVPEGLIEECAGYLYDPGLSVVAEAGAACGAARVHAMHDPTEGGLATALAELAEASSVGLRVEGDTLPVLEPARRLCRALDLDPLGLIASGALLLAVAPGDEIAVTAAIASLGVRCVRIATAVPAAQGLTMVSAAGERPLPRFARDEIARVF